MTLRKGCTGVYACVYTAVRRVRTHRGAVRGAFNVTSVFLPRITPAAAADSSTTTRFVFIIIIIIIIIIKNLYSAIGS